ncbi:hydrogen peroxide-inducible genes activator [Mesonia aestuariivivens]|uniref:LysR family transcriptional regulator n=1 Tax=Mesonia aestuariivivens TaxID=2796128 RepID=A0ABS6VXC2_9FLAO|nr:hydrogen peroxide-inducible genes activator [Mesonia aestuariivivens]MBW2960220.1 LysR family transcriptional regulator [Mesonia aestuariivivens]
MTIQQFKYVQAVVELKNFEAAAEKCFVTQSTLSTMISRLENEIDIKIFNRKTKPVSITSEGEQLIKRFRIINNEIDSLKNMIQEMKGEIVGEVKIGIIPTIAPYLLPLFLTAFAEKFPKVKIVVREMTTDQIQQELKIRKLDIGILALPLVDEELDELELFTEPFLLYDCTGEKSNEKVALESLNYSKVCLLQEGHCLRTQVQEICELSAKLTTQDVNFEIESGSMDSLLKITKIRKGITIIPHLATLDLREEEKNQLAYFQEPVPVRKVGLVTNKFFVKKKLLNKLYEVILASVKGLIPQVDQQKTIKPLPSNH